VGYTKVRIYASKDVLELVSALLIEKGIDAIELEDPKTYQNFINKRNSYDWDYIDPSLAELSKVSPNVIVYVDDDEAGIDLLDEIIGELSVYDIEKVELSSIDDSWKHKWKEYFHPFHVTDRIVIKPGWEDYEKAKGELVIEIDPGMAFGTGSHPTTALCIRLIEEYMKVGRTRVLDVGCGSGILTIAASLLGASQIVGVEIDEDAIGVAKKNIEVNCPDENIEIIKGDLTKGLDFRADILVANLMADLVIDLAKIASKNLTPKGVFISSGILLEKKEEVKRSVEDSGFKIMKTVEEDEWCAIAAILE
jgi:ribosomal protein L11 methyltransferase